MGAVLVGTTGFTFTTAGGVCDGGGGGGGDGVTVLDAV
jgi:hypothetical protein